MAAVDSKVSDELSQLKAVLKEAIQSTSPVVQQALKEERDLRARKAKEVTALLTAQQELVQKQKAELMAADVKKKVAEKLKTDGELLQILNKAASTNAKAAAPLKVNKMHLAISGAESLLQTSFQQVFEGNALDGYSFQYQPDAITILGDNSTRFGTAKGIFHDTLALTTYLTCAGKTNLSQVNLLSAEAGPWHRRSALVYDTPIPADIDLLKLDARFVQFTYAYDSVFGYVHGDYAWGGGRDGNTTHPWAPLDCSAWVARLTGSRVIYSTADQLCFDRTYQFRLSIDPTLALSTAALNEQANKAQIVPSNWVQGPELSVMDALYHPAVIKDPQKDIKPGQVYFHRNYDETTANPILKMLGNGGHTGLVLGFISNANKSGVAVLSYNRNIEGAKKMVGFGVEVYPLKPELGSTTRREIYFTNVGKAVSSAAVTNTATHTAAAGATAAAIPADSSKLASTVVAKK